jgi:predicted house-cleaning noncanonical NTP pyrophosphatase (MazG superfamily)
VSGKLVRDKIPAILDGLGVPHVWGTLSGTAMGVALRAKLNEEIAEYDAASGADAITDELADILEVVYAMAEHRGIASSTVDRTRARKADLRGRFTEGIWLEVP